MNDLQIGGLVIGGIGFVLLGMTAGWLVALAVAIVLWGYGLQLAGNAEKESEPPK